MYLNGKKVLVALYLYIFYINCIPGIIYLEHYSATCGFPAVGGCSLPQPESHRLEMTDLDYRGEFYMFQPMVHTYVHCPVLQMYSLFYRFTEVKRKFY